VLLSLPAPTPTGTPAPQPTRAQTLVREKVLATLAAIRR
jgi:hypothetical protein